MNRLIQRAPTTVNIDSIDYAINTNFRDCLFTIEKWQDSVYSNSEKLEILINNMYDEDPHDIQQAVEKAIWFLRCGKEIKNDNQPTLCDFVQDSDYIYNAILKKGIDLDKCDDLHWWTFMSYFSEIDESRFSRIVYLRLQKNKGKLTKEERKECADIGWDVIDIKNGQLEAERSEIERYIFGK